MVMRTVALTVSLGLQLAAAQSGPASIAAPGNRLSISGHVRTSTGRPPTGLSLWLGHEGPDLSYQSQTVELKSDGDFRIEGLEPGTYILEVNRPPEPVPTDRSGYERAQMVVTLADASVVGLTIRTAPSVSVKGTAVVETASGELRPLGPRCGPSSPVANLRAMVATDKTHFMGPAEVASVGPGGEFEFESVGGPVVIRLGGTCGAARLDRVLLDGEDITDTPVDFGKRSYKQLKAVFGQPAQGIAALVLDARGRPNPNAQVAVISADPGRRQWWASTTLVFYTHPDGQVWFSLPASKYVVAAVPKSKYPTVGAVLGRLEELGFQGQHVTVLSGETAQVQIAVTP